MSRCVFGGEHPILVAIELTLKEARAISAPAKPPRTCTAHGQPGRPELGAEQEKLKPHIARRASTAPRIRYGDPAPPPEEHKPRARSARPCAAARPNRPL